MYVPSILVLEFNPATDVLSIVTPHYRLSKEPDTLKIIFGFIKCIHFMHNICGIVHRDIKLSNFLLDDKLNVLITDFELSRAISKDNRNDMIFADLVSLGFCIYQLLSNVSKPNLNSFGKSRPDH